MYDIGTKLMHKKDLCEGVIISSEELMLIAPKLILDLDICVKWFNENNNIFLASTYSQEWLDFYCTEL